MSARRKKSVRGRKTAAAPRPRPRSYFGWIVLLVGAAQLLVLGARAAEGQLLHLNDLWPFLLWGGSSLLLCLGLRISRWRGSGALLAATLLLSGIGVVVRSRMSGAIAGVSDMHPLIQPAGFLLLFLVWIFFRRGRTAWLRGMAWPSALLSLALAGGLLLLGSRYRGGVFAPGGMTPTELLKLFTVLTLAGAFARRAGDWEGRGPLNPPWGAALPLLLFWGALSVLLVLHRDMGLVLLLSLTALTLLICATGRHAWGAAALAGGAAGVWFVLRHVAHGARRFHAFLDPFSDPTGAGWQVLQGLSGIYAGGLLGTGLGGGRPDRLPIASSDFVYAVYAEELGFVGSLLLLLLFAQLLGAGVRITRQQDEAYSRLLAAGLTGSLAAQTLVNLGGVVNLLPITGIPLPYISQGGSSYWVTSLHLGLLLALSDRE